MKRRTHKDEFERWFYGTMPDDKMQWMFWCWLAGAKFEREELSNIIDAELEGLEAPNGLRDHIADAVRDRALSVEASLAINVFDAHEVERKLKTIAKTKAEGLGPNVKSAA